MAKVERTNLFCRKPTPEVKDDYCGLELYLSPEKGEETQITSDLISEEVKKYGELENVVHSNLDQDLRPQRRRASQSVHQFFKSFHY